jgi:hypothetical protein
VGAAEFVRCGGKEVAEGDLVRWRKCSVDLRLERLANCWAEVRWCLLCYDSPL